MLITRRLLGRALYAQLCTDYPSSGGHAVIGWCGQRSHGNDFRSVDLTHESAIVAALNDAQPDVIVHSAAIRRPDAIKNDELLAQNVNVMAVRVIAEHVRAHAGVMLFISTDYVFDGVHPPFDERAPTCPLNEYGVQKVIGERLVQDTTGDAGIILRVPIMYGRVEYLAEGAVDEVLKSILRHGDGPLKLDHYHHRYPLHVEDAARAVCLLLNRRVRMGTTIAGVYHWRGDEDMTKYDMAMQMAEAFHLPTAQFVADTSAPPPEAAASRPRDARMSCERMHALGAVNQVRFAEGIKSALQEHVPPAP